MLLPNHVHIVDVIDGGPTKPSTRFVIACELHGRHTVPAFYLEHSRHGCPKCGAGPGSYADRRLHQLLRAGDQGRPSWLTVAEIEVFGIRSLWIAVRTGSGAVHEVRQSKRIHYSAELRELAALLICREIRRAFADEKDDRILATGEQKEARWFGDAACYRLAARARIVCFLRRCIARVERGEYADLQALQKMELHVDAPPPERRTKAGGYGSQAVVCLDTGVVYPSQSAASAALGFPQSSLARVLSGKTQKAGGLRWARKADVDAGRLPTPAARPSRNRRVVCLDTEEVFPSLLAAAQAKNCTSDHIRNICEGRGRTAGGLRWCYEEDFAAGNHPAFIEWRQKPVLCVDTGEVFPSVKAAADAHGVTSAAISMACSRKGRCCGKHWQFA